MPQVNRPTSLTWAFHIDSVEFTPNVIANRDSLGGSESACLGLARALQARGHRVHIFTTQLHPDAAPRDAWGVQWHRTADLHDVSRFTRWDVFVALRIPHIFTNHIPATIRVLWNQDLMTGEDAKAQTMSFAHAYDVVAYVSHYHRKQWEGIVPELAPIGWVTKNGYDPELVPSSLARNPRQIIHITRPERGLRPLLAMWPKLRAKVPDAELLLCRYNSMYDAQGWGRVCAAYDEQVTAVNAAVGGITYLGELGKPALYAALSQASVMWYPGVADFAETSCVAAIEAQACGLPFVGSYKGALPETVPHGILIKGDADTEAYQDASVDAVVQILRNGKTGEMVRAGLKHVTGYTFDRVAAEWEQQMEAVVARRLSTQAPAMLRQLLHEDDHCAAQQLAASIGDVPTVEWCQYVIDGKDQGAEDYAARALDTELELAQNQRIPAVINALSGAKRVLDVACGNGSFAIALAKADPERHVVAVDYAPQNIRLAQEAAERMGVAHQITFLAEAVYSYDTHTADPVVLDHLRLYGLYDGVFIGEFLEHTSGVTSLLSSLSDVAQTGARIVATMPSGPFGELASKNIPIKRGHVHHYQPDDLEAIFSTQDRLEVAQLDLGYSPFGSRIGHWIVSCTTSGKPFGHRNLEAAIWRTRPKQGLSVGILAGDTIDLPRCLESIWPIADDIILADTGIGAEALAPILGAYPKTRVVSVNAVGSLRGGFAEARNKTLAAAREHWFCWIDTDERLVGGQHLKKYLEGVIFEGYGIKQNHLQLDMPITFDTPIRIFRKQPAIEFYGCIHEQPQMHHCNGDITPALQVNDVQIAHTGYMTEAIRRNKALTRNLPLLVRDGEVFPDRRLHQLLVLRDHLNLAQWSTERTGSMSNEAYAHLRKVVELFERHFADPSDKYYALAYPFYELALKRVQGAVEIEVSFAAQVQGLKGHAKPERVWVRSLSEVPKVLAWKHAEWLKMLAPPTPVNTDPIV